MTDIFVAPGHKKKTQEPVSAPKHIPVLSYSEDVKAFSAFCKNPKGVSFQTQKHDESIVLFLRAHFITNLAWIIVSLILIILPVIILLFLPRLGVNFLSSSQAIRFTGIYVLFYSLIVFSYIFINFLHWFYTVFMVTTQQVVDIDYSDIVVHHVAVTNLSQVQDAKYTQSGFVSTFFNYGDIFVQTAGTQINFEEFSVPKPREATHIIGDLVGKGKK